MKRIAVISDSHGGMLHLERFCRLCDWGKYDMIFHLGDVVDDAALLRRRLSTPIHNVAGNCDFRGSGAPRELEISVEGRGFLLLHGDRYGVKYGYDRLSYYAEEKMADCTLFGHTHLPFAGIVGGALLVNPGALKSGDMCVLEVSEKDILPRLMNIDEITY